MQKRCAIGQDVKIKGKEIYSCFKVRCFPPLSLCWLRLELKQKTVPILQFSDFA